MRHTVAEPDTGRSEMAKIIVKVSGGFFRSNQAREVKMMLTDLTGDIGDYGQRIVVAECMRLFRKPTPYYWTQVTADRVVPDVTVSVNDHGIIYGPWLEGTSSRNAATRFKGYSIFRRTAQMLNREAPAFAVKVLSRYVARWNQ